MANTLLKDKARGLRTQGKSFNEIVNKLSVPKSTVRFWCRDITLTKQQLNKLYEKQRQGGILAAEKIRQKRQTITAQLLNTGIKEIGDMTRREIWIAGTALYWAEGYRKGNGEFGFTNSDPRMICFIIHWLTKACEVLKEDIRLRICINTFHKRRIKVIQKFWIKITKVPAHQFSRPTFIKVKQKKKYANSSDYFGTIRLKVRKSTHLRRKIMGWVEGLARITSPRHQSGGIAR